MITLDKSAIKWEAKVKHGAFGLAYSAHKNILAVGCGNSIVNIFDISTGEQKEKRKFFCRNEIHRWQKIREFRLPLMTNPKAKWPERDDWSKRVWYLSFSVDGNFLCCATDWDLVVFRTTDWASHFSTECANISYEGTRICWLGESHKLLFADSYVGHRFFLVDMDSTEVCDKVDLPVTKTDDSIKRIQPSRIADRILAIQAGPPEYRPCRVVDLRTRSTLFETNDLYDELQSFQNRILSVGEGWLSLHTLDDSGNVREERKLLDVRDMYPYDFWFSPDGNMALLALNVEWDRKDASRSVVIVPLSVGQSEIMLDATNVHTLDISGIITCDLNQLAVSCDETGRLVVWDLHNVSAVTKPTYSKSPEEIESIINRLPSAHIESFPPEARLLVECGADAVTLLIKNLMRSSMIPRILARIGDRRCIQPLMDLLKNGGEFEGTVGLTSPEFSRICAAEALGELKHKDALPILRKIHNTTPVWELSVATESAIKIIEDNTTTKSMCESCDKDDVPEKDLVEIDSGQLLCPDCLELLRGYKADNQE